MAATQVLFWIGSTDIDGCLKDFNEHFGGRLMAKNSIFSIFDNGWDKGNIDELCLLDDPAQGRI